MKNVKVLGSGCSNCVATAKRIQEVAQARGVAIDLEKLGAIEDIVRYGVMSTPAVVVDGVLVHAGGVPSAETIAGWF